MYVLHWAHLVWTSTRHGRNMSVFNDQVLFQNLLGILRGIQSMHNISFLKPKIFWILQIWIENGRPAFYPVAYSTLTLVLDISVVTHKVLWGGFIAETKLNTLSSGRVRVGCVTTVPCVQCYVVLSQVMQLHHDHLLLHRNTGSIKLSGNNLVFSLALGNLSFIFINFGKSFEGKQGVTMK